MTIPKINKGAVDYTAASGAECAKPSAREQAAMREAEPALIAALQEQLAESRAHIGRLERRLERLSEIEQKSFWFEAIVNEVVVWFAGFDAAMQGSAMIPRRDRIEELLNALCKVGGPEVKP